MDPFMVVIGGMLLTLVAALLFLGRCYPGDGSDVLDWDAHRRAELDARNEVDDMEQMLAATNRRRVARGKAPLTEGGVRDQIARDERALRARREDGRAGGDV